MIVAAMVAANAEDVAIAANAIATANAMAAKDVMAVARFQSAGKTSQLLIQEDVNLQDPL